MFRRGKQWFINVKHRDPSPDRLCIPRDIFVLKPPPNRIEYTHADDSAAVRVVLLPLRFPPALSNLNNGTGGRGGVRNIFIYIYTHVYRYTRVYNNNVAFFSARPVRNYVQRIPRFLSNCPVVGTFPIRSRTQHAPGGDRAYNAPSYVPA